MLCRSDETLLSFPRIPLHVHHLTPENRLGLRHFLLLRSTRLSRPSAVLLDIWCGR